MATTAERRTGTNRWLQISACAVAIWLSGCQERAIEIELIGDAKFARIDATWLVGPTATAVASEGPTALDVALPYTLRLPIFDDVSPGERRLLKLSLVADASCELAPAERDCTTGNAAVLFNGEGATDGYGGYPLSDPENPSLHVRRLTAHPFSFRTMTVENLANVYGSINAADLDRDGRSELIVTYAQNQLGLFRYEDGAGFVQYDLPFVGVGPRSVAVADLNGDGILDLATANSVSKDVSVLYGIGDGTFAMSNQLAMPPGETWLPEHVTIGNFDGQPPLDIAVAQRTDAMPAPASYRYVIFRGATTSYYMADLGLAKPSVPLITDRLVAIDIASDSLDDLLFLSDRSDRVLMRYGNSNLAQELGEFWDAIAEGTPCELVVAELTGPGARDLILRQCDAPSHFKVFKGYRFGEATFLGEIPSEIGIGLAVADFNSDGRIDVAIPAYYGPPRVQLFAGNGNGTFAPAVEFPLADAPTFAASADIDGDGRVDLIIGHGAPLPPIANVTLSPEPPRRITILRNLSR